MYSVPALGSDSGARALGEYATQVPGGPGETRGHYDPCGRGRTSGRFRHGGGRQRPKPAGVPGFSPGGPGALQGAKTLQGRCGSGAAEEQAGNCPQNRRGEQALGFVLFRPVFSTFTKPVAFAFPSALFLRADGKSAMPP